MKSKRIKEFDSKENTYSLRPCKNNKRHQETISSPERGVM